MNQFFFESRGREKLENLRKEGMASQAYYRSRVRKGNPISGLPKFILIVVATIWIIQSIVR